MKFFWLIFQAPQISLINAIKKTKSKTNNWFFTLAFAFGSTSSSNFKILFGTMKNPSWNSGMKFPVPSKTRQYLRGISDTSIGESDGCLCIYSL